MKKYRFLNKFNLFLISGFLVFSAAFADSVYQVQKGDTLYKISRKYEITVQELRAANNLSENDVLKAGQKLTIPKADIATAAALTQSVVTSKKENKSSSKNQANTTYKVQKGDTLYSLAKKNGITLGDLLSANGMNSSSTIKIGQTIIIPGKDGEKSAVSNKTETASGKNSQSANSADTKTASSGNAANGTNGKKDTKSDNSTAVASTAESSGKTSGVSGSKENASPGSSVNNAKLIWPLSDPVVKNISGKVSGVQLTGKDNETVKVVREGTVMYTGVYRGFGQVVFIQSKTGLIYSYSGLNSVNINKGDYVIAGGEIGTTGKGKESSIKFMVFQNGKPVDPAKAPRG